MIATMHKRVDGQMLIVHGHMSVEEIKQYEDEGYTFGFPKKKVSK